MGVIINSLSVLVGGLIGARFGDKISSKLKDNLPTVFGLGILAIGFPKIITMNNLTIVILSLILGYLLGEFLNLGSLINRLTSKFTANQSAEASNFLSLAIVAFCFSGTGLLGAFIEGLSGDSSILISKSVLDVLMAMIFASVAGYSIAFVSVGQIIILMLISLLAGYLNPIFTPAVLNDFMAVGGILTIAVGFKLMKMIDFDLINLLPSLVVVVFIANLF